MMKTRQSRGGIPLVFVGGWVPASTYYALQRYKGSKHATALGVSNNSKAIDRGIRLLPGIGS